MAKQNNDTGCAGCIIELFAWIIMIGFIIYIGTAIAGFVCVIGVIYGVFKLIKWIVHKKHTKKQDSINNTDFEKNEDTIMQIEKEDIQPNQTIVKKYSKKETYENEDRIKMYNNHYDYMTGEDFETFIAQILGKIGFCNIQLTKGSGDQGVDILAEKDNIKYAFQCKRYDKTLGNKAVQEVFAGKTFYNCDIGVVVTNSYFTQSAKDLANRSGIILWDRNELENLISLSELAGKNNLFYEWVELSDDEIKYFCMKIIDAFISYNIYLSAGECFADQGMTKYCFFPKSGTRLKNILSCKEDVSFFVGTVIDIMPNYEKGVIEIELPNKLIKEIVCKEDKLKKF